MLDEPLPAPVSPASHTSTRSASPASVEDFISLISLQASTSLLSSPPRLRVSRVPDYSVVPRRSSRLAGKPRVAKPEAQAAIVMLRKMGNGMPPLASDELAMRRFHETFR